MKNELINKFKYLPDEIIHIIINFTDVITYRYGKYINRLNKGDYRYKLIIQIPRPIYIGSHTIMLKLTDDNYSGYFIKYIMSNHCIKMNVRFFYREKDGFDNCYIFKSENDYVFDKNNVWHKTIHYLM